MEKPSQVRKRTGPALLVVQTTSHINYVVLELLYKSNTWYLPVTYISDTTKRLEPLSLKGQQGKLIRGLHLKPKFKYVSIAWANVINADVEWDEI